MKTPGADSCKTHSAADMNVQIYNTQTIDQK